jgi:hypothetical protein
MENDTDYFAGLEVSLTCALCIVDAKGNICLEREHPGDVEAIAHCLNGFAAPVSRKALQARTIDLANEVRGSSRSSESGSPLASDMAGSTMSCAPWWIWMMSLRIGILDRSGSERA